MTFQFWEEAGFQLSSCKSERAEGAPVGSSVCTSVRVCDQRALWVFVCTRIFFVKVRVLLSNSLMSFGLGDAPASTSGAASEGYRDHWGSSLGLAAWVP